MSDFRFSPATGRYHNVASGRMVSERDVRDAVDRLADLASQKLGDLSDRLLAGRITLADWQQEAMAVLKDAHVAAATVAHGGKTAMDPEDWGYLGSRIKEQYQYLQAFAEQISRGDQALNGGVGARARLYGQAVRSTFEAVRARDDVARGMDEERNVLHAADHCGECRELSVRGWVPIGTLPPIGVRQCGANDRCSMTRRRSADHVIETGRLLWVV